MSFWDMYLLKTMLVFVVFFGMLLFGYAFNWLRMAFCRKRLNSISLANEFHKAISSFLLVFTTLYTFVLTNSFSVFRCFPQDDSTYTLISSPSLDCYDSLWFQNIWLIIVNLLIIVFSPIVLFLILYRNKHISIYCSQIFSFGNMVVYIRITSPSFTIGKSLCF
jgi:hypothetical protein